MKIKKKCLVSWALFWCNLHRDLKSHIHTNKKKTMKYLSFSLFHRYTCTLSYTKHGECVAEGVFNNNNINNINNCRAMKGKVGVRW